MDSEKIVDAIRELQEEMRFQSASSSTKVSADEKETAKRFRSLNHEMEETEKEFRSLGLSSRNLNPVIVGEIKARVQMSEQLLIQKEAIEKSREALKSLGQELISTKRGFDKYNKGVESLSESLAKSISRFGPFEDKLGGITGKLGSMIEVAGKLASVYFTQADNLLKANDELSKFGTAGSFTTDQLMDMAHRAGVTSKNMDTLVKPMTSLGSNLLMLGKNTGDGVKAFSDLVAISHQQREEFQRLGISQEQLYQTQADYIALQGAAGRNIKAEIADRKALQQASLDYQTSLVQLSTLTGQDVESIKKKQQEAARSLEFQIGLAQLENKARRAEAQGREDDAAKLRAEAKARTDALANISAIGNETVTKGVRAFISTGTIAAEETQSLARMGLMKELNELRIAIKKGENVQEATNKFQDAYNKKFGETIDNVGFSAQQSKDVARLHGLEVQSLENFNRQRDINFQKEGKLAQDRIKGAQKPGKDPAQDARAALTTLEIKASVALDQLIGKINPLVGGFSAVTIFGTAAAIALGGLAKNLAAGRLDSLKTSAADKLKEARDIFRGAPKVSTGGIVDSIPTGGGGPSPKGISGLPGAASSAGKSLGDLGTGAGKLTSTVGEGGGKTIEGILKGLAAGLKEFYNPKILVGAGIFSASIGLIITGVGAGIAAATWLMGAALPKLVGGIDAFTKIDGDKLSKAGKGILDLGKGLAIFGAGSVLGSFGSVVSSMIEGFYGLFGVKSPFQKLEEFSKLKIDTEAVKKNAEALTAFGTALSSVKGIPSDLGTSFKSMIGFQSFSKLEEFGKLSLNVDGVKQNAEALTVFGKALSGFTGIPSDLGNSSKSVNKFQSFAKLEEFGNLTVNVDGVKKNSEALGAFTKAISGFTGIPSDLGNSDKSLKGIQSFSKLEEFGKLTLDIDNIKKNSDALSVFNKALAVGSSIPKDFKLYLPSALELNKLDEFSKLSINSKAVKNTSDSITIFTKAINDLKETPKDIKINFPDPNKFKRLETFSKMDINSDQVKKSSDALLYFTRTLARIPKIPDDVYKTISKLSKIKGLDKLQILAGDKGTKEQTPIKTDKIESSVFDAGETAKAEAQRQASSEFFERAQKVGAASRSISDKGSPIKINGKIVGYQTDEGTVALPGQEKALKNAQSELRGMLGAKAKTGDIAKAAQPSRDVAALFQPNQESLGPTDLTSSVVRLNDSFIQLSDTVNQILDTFNLMSGTYSKFDNKLKKDITQDLPKQLGSNLQDSLKTSMDKAKQLRGDLGEPTAPAAAPSTFREKVSNFLSNIPFVSKFVKPPSGPSQPPPLKQDIAKNLSQLKGVLTSKGLGDQNYINAVLANVMKETGGKLTEENLNYGGTSNERIRKIFGSRAQGISDKDLDKIKRDPKQMGELMYGSTTAIGKGMGNVEPGDGWKYRGRGYIQLTGKTNYTQASQAIFGDDRLVKDPDLVNDPNIASEVTAWYMQKTKGAMQRSLGLKEGPLTQSQANQLATSQIAGRPVSRGQGFLGETLAKVDKFSSQVASISASKDSLIPEEKTPIKVDGKIVGYQTENGIVAVAGQEDALRKAQAGLRGQLGGRAPITAASRGTEPTKAVDLPVVTAEVPTAAPVKSNLATELTGTPALTKAEPTPVSSPATVAKAEYTELLAVNQEMLVTLRDRMDLMLSELSKSNSTQDKLLQVARV